MAKAAVKEVTRTPAKQPTPVKQHSSVEITKVDPDQAETANETPQAEAPAPRAKKVKTLSADERIDRLEAKLAKHGMHFNDED